MLKNKRKTLRKSTDSFNIGLIGDWGSGKTSITDTLIYELEKENKYFFLKISALTFNETGNIIEYVKNFFGNLFKRYETFLYNSPSNKCKTKQQSFIRMKHICKNIRATGHEVNSNT